MLRLIYKLPQSLFKLQGHYQANANQYEGILGHRVPRTNYLAADTQSDTPRLSRLHPRLNGKDQMLVIVKLERLAHFCPLM